MLPPASARWQALESTFAKLVARAGYGQLRTPLFEDVGVFHRIGEATEVVRKEMYDFDDKGGRRIALRPEGTASVVRAYVQHRPTAVPWKVWYSAPMFRYERPQAGRYRQHQQLGLEALGSDDADLDVEVISLQASFYDVLGLRRVLLLINSLGDANCKPQYLTTLGAYLGERRRKAFRDRLRQGALVRAERDRRLAEEWFPLEEEAWERGKAAPRRG